MVICETISVIDKEGNSGLIYLLASDRQIVKKDQILKRVLFNSIIIQGGKPTIFGLIGNYCANNYLEFAAAKSDFLLNLQFCLQHRGYRTLE